MNLTGIWIEFDNEGIQSTRRSGRLFGGSREGLGVHDAGGIDRTLLVYRDRIDSFGATTAEIGAEAEPSLDVEAHKKSVPRPVPVAAPG